MKCVKMGFRSEHALIVLVFEKLPEGLNVYLQTLPRN